MATPWIKSVRDAKTLTVFNGIGSGHWANIFAIALDAFNNFAKPAGIKMVKSNDEEKANIVIRIADGMAVYEYEKTKYQKPFSATGLHGLTKTLARDGMIEKVFVFLPARPQETVFDNKGNQIERMVGHEVMKVIAVHELIHACCLDEMKDHGGDSLFYYPLHYRTGKVYVPERGKNQALMPPIRPDAIIVNKIKALW
jgi:predicted Zn-dependent protease with MMP-like domain